MRLKAFSIFCLSFLVMFTLTSCDNENLVNEEELNFSDENPAITVLAEQKAGNDGYDEKGFSIVNCLNFTGTSQALQWLKAKLSTVGSNQDRTGKCRRLCLVRNCWHPMGRDGTAGYRRSGKCQFHFGF